MELIPGHEADSRAASMRRNMALEQLLAELNAALATAQSKLSVNTRDCHHKLFLVGPMRSGTTLYMQWLAQSGLFSYPTNILSRFYGAPFFGAKIQQVLADPAYSFKEEMADFWLKVGFNSANGKTSGALAPNEFWYFWRRFLPTLLDGYCSDDELRETSDLAGLRDEVNGLSNIFDRPLAMKALIVNQNIGVIDKLFTRPIFVWMRREPVFNMQSTLLARQLQYGTMNEWYSFKIKEYPELKDLDPLHSVAGQVYAINKHIERSLAGMPSERKILTTYEEFCRNPRSMYEELVSRLESGNSLNAQPYRGEPSFKTSNSWSLQNYSRTEAEQAYLKMSEVLGECL